MPSIDTLQRDADQRNLVRKILTAIAYLAPMSVDLPTTLFGPDGQPIDFKEAGFKPVGLVTPAGFTFGREISTEPVNALGYTSAIREDTTEVVRTVGFTALETGRRHMTELKYGVDLSGVTQNPTTGELVWDEPDLPINEDYRCLIIGSDGPATERWIQARAFGRVKLASTGDESWGQESAQQHEYSLGVFTDDELGSPGRHFLGGTAAVKHSALLGYNTAAA